MIVEAVADLAAARNKVFEATKNLPMAERILSILLTDPNGVASILHGPQGEKDKNEKK